MWNDGMIRDVMKAIHVSDDGSPASSLVANNVTRELNQKQCVRHRTSCLQSHKGKVTIPMSVLCGTMTEVSTDTGPKTTNQTKSDNLPLLLLKAVSVTTIFSLEALYRHSFRGCASEDGTTASASGEGQFGHWQQHAACIKRKVLFNHQKVKHCRGGCCCCCCCRCCWFCCCLPSEISTAFSKSDRVLVESSPIKLGTSSVRSVPQC